MDIYGKTEKRRGRPATGRDPSVTMRFPAPLLQWIDGEAKALEIGRSEMVLRLIEESRLGVPQQIGRIRTAYHEAGHAVMARRLDIPVELATILPGKKSLGHVKTEAFLSTHDRQQGKFYVMMLMAGREAERMVLDFHHDTNGDRMDQRKIRRLAKWLMLDESDIENLRRQTRRELMTDIIKQSVKRVADALLRLETIDQKRIDAIIAMTPGRLSR
jgi:ATP-dependent Zn protease